MIGIDDAVGTNCAYCGKPLFGRTDKRFCNDGCRNAFNRKKLAELKNKNHENLPEIFKIIKRNYEILKSFGEIEDQCGIFDLDSNIKDQGINTNYFTSIYIDGDTLWKFCFERGWNEFDNGGWQVKDRLEQVNID